MDKYGHQSFYVEQKLPEMIFIKTQVFYRHNGVFPFVRLLLGLTNQTVMFISFETYVDFLNTSNYLTPSVTLPTIVLWFHLSMIKTFAKSFFSLVQYTMP